MGYKGKQEIIEIITGGFNGNTNYDILPPNTFVDVENINLHEGIAKGRGGSSILNSTNNFAEDPRIMGGGYFEFKNGDKRHIVATSNGKIYHDTDWSTPLISNLATSSTVTFTYWNDNVYINNGKNNPMLYNGSSISLLSGSKMPSDWANSYPKKMIVHGKGNSERLWGIGVSDFPFAVYGSDNGTDDFSNSVVFKRSIRTTKGTGLINIVEFGDRLLLFSEDKSYILDDTDTSVANWGYVTSQFQGGCANINLLVKTDNNIYSMMDDGEIYSVITTQEYGDYKAASITRPAFIHEWIKDNIDLTLINNFHMIYDPFMRAIKVFMVRKNKTKVDVCLLYFIDRPSNIAWSKHKGDSTSGYDASCSYIGKDSLENIKTFTGGYAGYVWKLEDSTYNDNGNYFTKKITFAYAPLGDVRYQKIIDNGWIVLKPIDNENVYINLFADGKEILAENYLIDDNGNYLIDDNSNFLVGGSVGSWIVTAIPGANLINLMFKLGLYATRIQTTIYNNELNKNMAISKILYDYRQTRILNK